MGLWPREMGGEKMKDLVGVNGLGGTTAIYRNEKKKKLSMKTSAEESLIVNVHSLSTKDKPEDHWPCIAHLSVEDM